MCSMVGPCSSGPGWKEGAVVVSLRSSDRTLRSQANPEAERLRAEAIAAYRASKKGGTAGGATLESLARLAKSSAASGLAAAGLTLSPAGAPTGKARKGKKGGAPGSSHTLA
jgi:hypothetical protein